MMKIADFAPEGVEAGVGLAIQDEAGCYLFFLAGTRHRCPPGELFYAGIGGHREPGESWLECARREAHEEIGIDIEILPATTTYLLMQGQPLQSVEIEDEPRPFALYEMIHPPNTSRAGESYRIVIYRARLQGTPQDLPPDELLGVIALTKKQVRQGIERKPTLEVLLAEGAAIVAGGETVDRQTHLYPIGTAYALGQILKGKES